MARAIIVPDPLQTVPWATLIQKLTQHYAPKPPKRRHAFYWRDQVEEFRDLDETLRDKLVSGVQDIRLQRRLLARATLTLKEALDEAIASEQSGRSVEEIQIPKTARWAATVHREETEDIGGDEDADDSEEEVHKMRAAPPTRRDRDRERKTAQCMGCGGKHPTAAC
ncbi:hypothetical protein E2320_022883 [Naja naja]|nr:hypothetical protein E2320_022883 [Naja naja]